MIIIYDGLYCTTYRNITDILFRGIPVFGVQKYRFDFRFDDDKKEVLWLDSSPIRRYSYIQLGKKQYYYDEIKKNELKFMLKLNNELTKTTLEVLE